MNVRQTNLKHRIQNCETEMQKHKDGLKHLEKMLGRLRKELQAVCAHDDWDCADGGAMGGGFDYTCKNCGKREYI